MKEMGEKVSVDGHLFDTGMAKKHWDLEWFDGNSNLHSGDLYVSTTDIWYALSPSQWANGHSWELLGSGEKGAKEALLRYSDYLEQSEIEEIAEMGKIQFE